MSASVATRAKWAAIARQAAADDKPARLADMIARRARGETLESIAQGYGITRERVRQLTASNVSAEEALAAARGWRLDEMTSDRLRDLVAEHGGVMAAAKSLGTTTRTLAPFVTDEIRALVNSLHGRRARERQRALHGTEAKIAEAVRLRCEGLTYETIADRMGMLAPAARRLVLLAGPDPLGRAVSPHCRRAQRKQEALTLRRQGLRYRDIAERLGYSTAGIARASALSAAADEERP